MASNVGAAMHMTTYCFVFCPEYLLLSFSSLMSAVVLLLWAKWGEGEGEESSVPIQQYMDAAT